MAAKSSLAILSREVSQAEIFAVVTTNCVLCFHFEGSVFILFYYFKSSISKLSVFKSQ